MHVTHIVYYCLIFNISPSGRYRRGPGPGRCGADRSAVRPVADRKGHDRRYALDDSKLRALGYRPQVAFEDGLAETITWYGEHTDWWRPLLSVAPASAPST